MIPPVRPAKSAAEKLYRAYLRGALYKRRPFALSFDDFEALVSAPCWYCGLEPGGGIDRVDNSCGYHPGNARPCCKQCNRAKGVLAEAEFLAWIARLLAFRTRPP